METNKEAIPEAKAAEAEVAENASPAQPEDTPAAAQDAAGYPV